jgi:hypothetical protein
MSSNDQKLEFLLVMLVFWKHCICYKNDASIALTLHFQLLIFTAYEKITSTLTNDDCDRMEKSKGSKCIGGYQ